MRCFLPSWWTQTKSDHSRQQSRNHLGPPAIENCVPDKVFIFVYFWTGTVMLGSLACVPVNYVHRQPALFLHKVILTIYFSDISRYYIPTGPLTMSTDSLPLFAQSKLDNLQS